MAGAASHNDFGVNFVRHVHKLAGVPYEATSWELRGFCWWVGDYRQHIWSELGVGEDEDSMVFKVCTATDFVHEVDANSSELIDKMAAAARSASTSALVYEPRDRTLRHWSTFTVDETVGSWVLPLVIGSAYSQLASVNSAREDVEAVFGGKRHQNNRPMRGPDSCQHERVNGWNAECQEEGRTHSAWTGTGEFAEAVDSLRRVDTVATLVGDGLTAEFPFAAGTNGHALLQPDDHGRVTFEMETATPHSAYGNGLSTRLNLPLSLPEDLAHHLCAVLNLLETREFTRSSLVGSWCVSDSGIVFANFIPNILYVPGMVLNLALAARARTQWVATKLGDGNRERAAADLVASMLQDLLKGEKTAEAPVDSVGSRKSGFLQKFLRR